MRFSLRHYIFLVILVFSSFHSFGGESLDNKENSTHLYTGEFLAYVDLVFEDYVGNISDYYREVLSKKTSTISL